jgi:hypothetical protein
MKKQFISLLFFLAATGLTYSQHATSEPVNINFKNRSYFYAASPPLESTSGFGGWAESVNMYQALAFPSPYETGKLTVHVDANQQVIFAEKYRGYTLYVVNTVTDTLFFDAQDSRLDMKLQAQDSKGEWKDIEYIPSSWCGNSYHTLYLPSSYYWRFSIPVYEGKIKTQIRAALAWKSSRDAEQQWVYSNEFAGSINAGQFSKMPKYTPGGLMDPYNN